MKLTTESKRIAVGAGIVALVFLLVVLHDRATAAVIPVTTQVTIDGATATVTLRNNIRRDFTLDEGFLVYTTTSGKLLKQEPRILKLTGSKLTLGDSSWSVELPAGKTRTLKFALANQPQKPYCLKASANVYGRFEGSVSVETHGRDCTS